MFRLETVTVVKRGVKDKKGRVIYRGGSHLGTEGKREYYLWVRSRITDI